MTTMKKKGNANMWRNQTSHILSALSIKTKYILIFEPLISNLTEMCTYIQQMA